MRIAPSILTCDFNNLEKEINSIQNADFIHLDIMDGHFVPNISFGPTVVKNINIITSIPMEAHLMISDPMKYARKFKEAGVKYITFHYESVDNIKEVIDYLKSLDVLVGISIKPNTDVSVLEQYLNDLDLILIMSVEPGFGGQSFMESSLDKIKYLKNKKEINSYHYLIEVDGGINKKTALQVKQAGCEVVVVGTFLFNNINRKQLIEEMKNL